MAAYTHSTTSVSSLPPTEYGTPFIYQLESFLKIDITLKAGKKLLRYVGRTCSPYSRY